MSLEQNNSAVQIDNAWKIFQQEAEEVQAVRGVTMSIESGEFTALAGPSGSGKTTLLNLMGGLTRPTRGRVFIAGNDLTAMSKIELARLRLEKVGFVFQAYYLLPVLTAMENAEFPLLLQGVDLEERRIRVRELFARTGLVGLENRRPGKLSGGQQQRVAVIRAVASKPALVLADEPTANLDSNSSEALLEMMLGLNKNFGTTFLFATHDSRVMARSRRVIRLVDGSIVSDETDS